MFYDILRNVSHRKNLIPPWKSQGLSFFSFLLINALKKCVTLFLVNNQLQKETILSTVFNHLFHCDNSLNKKQTFLLIKLVSTSYKVVTDLPNDLIKIILNLVCMNPPDRNEEIQ